MIILGIDPGTRVMGYALLSYINSNYSLIDFGAIRPPSTCSEEERYYILFQAIETLIDQYQPVHVAVEHPFVHKNVSSALKLGMAMAAVLIAAAKKGIPVSKYAPRQAKHAVTGSGSASKEQVQKMMQLLFNLEKAPTPQDAADALSIALCHTHYHVRIH